MSIDLLPDDIEMTKADFANVARRVRISTGIVLKPHKEQMVRARLSRRLKARSIRTVSAYLSLLERSDESTENTAFINAITTNLTSFFRERHHFDHLKTALLPNAPGGDRIRIWSAGCSTGEEPVSISITLDQAKQNAHVSQARILATDIDTAVLSRAKTGVYHGSGALDAANADQSAFRRGPNEGSVEVRAEILRRIAYLPLNLLGRWPMQKRFDAIFCRNVLIYFDAETKAALIDRFVAQLHPGGVLYLGHSEALLSQHPQLSAEGQTTYRKSL
ncbi:MAG: protein-glutamate O-methyltransferase CheR [Pseudomonadota bacterium]